MDRHYIDFLVLQIKAASDHVPKNAEAELSHNKILDDLLTRYGQDLIEEQLAHGRRHGRHGWWSESVCAERDIELMLNKAMQKRDFRAVTTLAAMLHARQAMNETTQQGEEPNT